MSERQQRNVALWLLSICAVIFCMISLGGVTRLTGSGLSMVEWAPLTGILPPLGEGQWQAVFKLYQVSPEFIKVNPHLTLEGFKSIFWFEYFHRILGRLIGLLFLLPMVYFFARYPLSARQRLQLLGLFVLGGAQGLLGWYMVKSGLVNDPHVSQYRLVAHLSLALLLYSVILWQASGYFMRDWTQRYATPVVLWRSGLTLFIMVALAICAGGFVAGTHAGFAFNTFPLMHGQLVPEGYAALHPLWRNFFENIAAVQFNHRLLATTVLLLAVAVAGLASRAVIVPALKKLAGISLLLVLAQYILGVLTLLNHVPVLLGGMHQAVAVMVLTASLLFVRAMVQLRQ